MMSPALHFSCITQHFYPSTLENFKKLCVNAGLSFKSLENATCCGLPYFEKGELKAAKAIGEYNLKTIGQDKIICNASKCYLTFKDHYPRIFNNTVSHNEAVQLAKNTNGLSELINKLSATFLETPSGYFFFVNDCCSNQSINHSLEKMSNCNWTFSTLASNCCGAGTSMPTSNFDLASKMTLNMIQEFKSSDCEAMVFEDDICRKQVDHIASLSNISIQTLHLIDILMLNQK